MVAIRGGELAAAPTGIREPADGRHAGASVPEGSIMLPVPRSRSMRQNMPHERLLRLAGYRVKSVADGQAALSAAGELKPDLVLTDVICPNLMASSC